MKRRYDLARSDNFMYTDRVSYVCSGTGTINVVTGFPVTRAAVAFATIPWPNIDGGFSSSSESGTESTTLPRVYVSSYTATGFVVGYEGIPEDIGYIEFVYSAV